MSKQNLRKTGTESGNKQKMPDKGHHEIIGWIVQHNVSCGSFQQNDRNTVIEQSPTLL